jgi:hypothetical protein
MMARAKTNCSIGKRLSMYSFMCLKFMYMLQMLWLALR